MIIDLKQLHLLGEKELRDQIAPLSHEERVSLRNKLMEISLLVGAIPEPARQEELPLGQQRSTEEL